jgi:hypothetical protein
MSKAVIVDIPHQLGRAEARQRLQRGFGRIREQFGTGVLAVEEKWLGDRLEFSAKAIGQKVAGRLEVLEKSVRIELDLPWALAVLAERLHGRVTRAAMLLLEKR